MKIDVLTNAWLFPSNRGSGPVLNIISLVSKEFELFVIIFSEWQSKNVNVVFMNVVIEMKLYIFERP